MAIDIYPKINIQEKGIKLLKVTDLISVCQNFLDCSHSQMVRFELKMTDTWINIQPIRGARVNFQMWTGNAPLSVILLNVDDQL